MKSESVKVHHHKKHGNKMKLQTNGDNLLFHAFQRGVLSDVNIFANVLGTK